MLLSAPILRAVLIEFDLPADAFGADPERSAVQAAALVGYVRFVISQKGWSVRSSLIDFAAFVDPTNLRCDVQVLCQHVTALTVSTGVTPADYERELQTLFAKKHDPYQVARGHDISNLLAWAISVRSKKKRKDGGLIKGFLIESYLRTAYPDAAFALTELFKKIKEWEERNEPFLVLRKV